jgi:hypothetical protein
MTTQTLESIPCKTCSGQMNRTAVRRFSPGIVFMGYTLLIPSVLILLMSSACAVFTCGSATKVAADEFENQKQAAIKQLAEIRDVPKSLVDDFQQDGQITPASLDALPTETKEQVQRVVDGHTARVAGAAIGTTVVGGVGTAVLAITYFFFLPAMIVGALLTLRKNVWACQQCGGIIDRK